MNSLNLYTTRTHPRYLEVQGAAQTTATVQVDGSTNGVLRQGEYFRRELGRPLTTGALAKAGLTRHRWGHDTRD